MIGVKTAEKRDIKAGTAQISIYIYYILYICKYICICRQTWKRVDVKCAICGDKSHPTNDCPFKKEQGGLKTLQDPTLEDEFDRIMAEMKHLENKHKAPKEREDNFLSIGLGNSLPEQSATLAIEIENGGMGVLGNYLGERAHLTYKGRSEEIGGEAEGQKVRIIEASELAAMQEGGNIPAQPMSFSQELFGNKSEVRNPVMNPLFAQMYTPYVASYNALQNPNAYANITSNYIIYIYIYIYIYSSNEFFLGRISQAGRE